MAYKDYQEFLKALDQAGLLVTVSAPINKDTQLAPLVRLQNRGLPDEQKKGFLFTNVTDSKGKRFSMPVAAAAHTASRACQAVAMQCRPEEIFDRLFQASGRRPIEPKLVKNGPAQEVVHIGDSLLEKGGVGEFPVPISTPGYDGGPIMSGCVWVTKDPDTGIRNAGNYRAQVYAPDRLGVHFGETDAHIAIHWQKCRAKGIPLQCAIVHGGPPQLVNVPNPKYGVDEFAVAGGAMGEAVEMVKCKTVDLEVPAHAEVVIEGTLSMDDLEVEAPHGEHTTYVGMFELMPYLKVTCITERKNPVWVTMPMGTGGGGGAPVGLFKRLKYDLGLSSVLKVGSPEFTAGFGQGVTIIQFKMHSKQEEIWRALEACCQKGDYSGMGPNVVIAVDEDIDPSHPDMFWWAITTRTLPHRDYKIIKNRGTRVTWCHLIPEEEMMTKVRHHQLEPGTEVPEGSCLLINATLKWAFPPINMPKKEFMDGALAIWKELGLPPLNLKEPWYGYELGEWPKQAEEDAQRAVKSEYYKTSEMRAKNRVKLPKADPKAIQEMVARWMKLS